MDEEHHKHVCGVLREVNEDEHDLRSGRRMKEFEFPGKGHGPRYNNSDEIQLFFARLAILTELPFPSTG